MKSIAKYQYQRKPIWRNNINNVAAKIMKSYHNESKMAKIRMCSGEMSQ